ncbi:MAG: hypothetical protein IPP43_07910 [Chitinophagaceae bacterium]|nr:hypothetical protein [Chitinophagaceae bacterium]
MKNLFLLATLTLGMACNNSKKEKAPGTGDTDTTTSPTENNTLASNNAAPSAGSASVMYSVADTARNLAGSVLVQKIKTNYLQVTITWRWLPPMDLMANHLF